MEILNREKCCCFTGHRPEKLSRGENEVRELLKCAIIDAYKNNITTFITGMAQGVDIWAAEAVLELKETGADISLICAFPYKQKISSWSKAKKTPFERITAGADEIIYISEDYSMGVHQRRDAWMVDNSSLVIAVYDGVPGGTRWTINYALSEGVKVIML